MFDKLFLVVTHNISFYILVLFSVVFGVFIKLWFKDKVVWWEAVLQVVISCVFIFICYGIFFQTSSGIADFDIRNGFVTQANYYEAWVEEQEVEDCSGSGKDRSCSTHTEYTDHDPYWELLTSIGDTLHISEVEYHRYVDRFKNEKKEYLHRASQHSIGDGNMFKTVYPNAVALRVPTAVEYNVVNYLKGSSSIKKRFGNTKGFEKLLLPHPRVYNSGLGPIEINRVLSAGVTVPSGWVETADKVLDYHMSYLGVTRQVNALIYLVNTTDTKFFYALEESWVNAKKNEVVVVIGSTVFPKIDWVNIISWSKNEEFKIKLRDKLLELDLSDPSTISETIAKQIDAHDGSGFERLRMRELEYLVADITLPTWVQVLIVLLGVGANVGLAVVMVNNNTQNYSGGGRFNFKRRRW